MAAFALTSEQRTAILQREVDRYISRGYRVTAQTASTAQLVKPKVFSRLWAFLWFLLAGVGLIVYLLWYAAKRDGTVYLSVDADGKVQKK